MIKKDSLRALEFERVLEIISTHAHSGATRRAIAAIRPLRDREEIARRSLSVREIRRLIEEQTPLGFERFEDITGLVEKALPEGALLEAVELLRFLPPLAIIASISSLLDGREDLPRLRELTAGLTGFPKLLEAIERSIDHEGNIRDTASPELQRTRASLRGLDRKINRRLEEITRAPEVAPFLQDEFITKRSGRWVIPVRMDSKGMVMGVVHDVSRSGETAFMEPLEIIGLSNELENLIAEERAEEIRILKGICRGIRAGAEEIKSQFGILVYLDLLNGIAVFSELFGLQSPEINDSSAITITSGRHPLLMLQRGPGGQAGVVPLDLSLGRPERAMVITGPNAGGKTIAIKAVGLLLLMALSGMPVPADSSSSFPLVGELLVDIGDEQSIEYNLSTFSAHISNISGILERAGPGALVLMDELGTGTDPQQGAALGSAVLRGLTEKGALVLATTHLIDIVGFVHREEGMLNASMEFDQATLTPLYRLKAGEPGQSHALEVAEKFGLPRRVIDLARSMLGDMQAEFHSLLAELRERRAQYEKALGEMEKEREALRARLEETEREKKGVLEQAYAEAGGVVSEIKRKVYEILEEARRDKTRASLRKLDRLRQEVEEDLGSDKKAPALAMDEIKEGDTVFVSPAGCDAAVLELDLKRGRLRVKAGEKELDVPVAEVGPARGMGEKKGMVCHPEQDGEVSRELNLVGLRVDEAVSRLEPFLNQASLSGLGEARVIHGIGTGALRRAVRERLEGHPLVEGVREGERSEGGGGVTMVRLR